MSRDSFFVPGAEGSRGRLCLRGQSCFRVRVCLLAGTSDRCAPAVLSLPPLRGGPLTVHEATGGYAVRSPCPSGIPRPRHNAVLPWAGGITPVLTSALHRFASLGLKSRIDAWIAPVLTLWLHRFASLGLKSRIDARIAPVLTLWLHRFASLGLKSRIDAALSCRQVEWPACSCRSLNDAVSDSNFRCLKEE